MAFSKLEIYSIGEAAENKKLGSRILEVTPIEVVPMLNGEINADQTVEKIKSQDASGGTYEVKTTTANSVPATWLPLGSSNRFTPPDIRRGERVVLYRFADQAKFYWATLFDDIALRKLETVIYAWSGTKDESVTEVTPEHYYFLEVSTHRGLIHFHTSKKNGEFTSFDVQLNAKDGLIRIQDDLGQLVIVDSKERQVLLKNADDCYFELNKKNATLHVPETFTIKAKNIVEEVVDKIAIKAGTSISEKTGDKTVDASGSIKEKAAGPVEILGAGVKIKGPVSLA